MGWITIVKWLTNVGLGKAWEAIRYSLQRDRLSGRRPPRGPSIPPGALRDTTLLPYGALFSFSDASLDVSFLAPDLVCLTWQPGTLPVPYAVVEREWSPVELTMQRQDHAWMLAGPVLSVVVRDDGGLRFVDPAGNTLRQEDPPLRRGDEWRTNATLRTHEHLYGLGEHAGGPNLRGRTCTLWNTDPGGGYAPDTEPLYLGVPVYLTLHPAGGTLLFYENSFRATFSMQEGVEAALSGGALRYYFAAGTPPQLLQRYTDLTGRPALPPRWALGYHQSRWGYRTADEVRQVVAGFRNRALPLDALHLDIDHMDGYRLFTADPERFPDLGALAGELQAQGVRLVTIVDCGVKRDPDYGIYRDGRAQGTFCRHPDGSPLHAPVWPGWCAFPDFTDPRARAWWGMQYRRLTAAGVAGFWHDMNEPAAFAAWGDRTLPLATRHALEGRGGDHREAHNLYGLLMARAAYEALREIRPESRPWIVSRSGWAGLQRYAWTWTGDTDSTWPALRATVPTVLGLGLSGLPFTGPDIGGFNGAPSGELYLRWFQLAAFLPFFRTHSALGTPRREPWALGKPVLRTVRDFSLLRRRLLPYLYTLAWEASQTGWPLVRPLFWAGDAAEELWDVGDAFLLGDALLVAPVVEEGAVERTVPLPPGPWYGFWDDTLLEGSEPVQLAAPLERIPVLVRGGSVLPLEEEGRLVLHLYPPADGQEGRGMLYSDAGDGYGPSRVDRFTLARAGRQLALSWDGHGDFPLPYAAVEVQVHGLEGAVVLVNGVPRAVGEPFDAGL